MNLLLPEQEIQLCLMFLDDQNYIGTHLLFIDGKDIGFQPQNIERLIRADKDIACGIYPRKCIHWNQVIDAVKKIQILQKMKYLTKVLLQS